MNKNNQKNNKITGRLTVNARGFGFVEVPDGNDLFIPFDFLDTGMNGDLVEAEVVRKVKGKNPVGRITGIKKRYRTQIVGIYKRSGKGGTVTPENERLRREITIPAGKFRGKDGTAPSDGEAVLVELENWDDPKENPRGRILEVIGSPEKPETDVRLITRRNGIKTEFPPEVLKQAAEIKKPRIKDELKRREDLRKWDCITIDPEKAKDFDDAVSLEQLKNGLFRLGVHIADVSFYVPEGTPLDQSGYERGTSVYLVKDVIPMLPENLSNNICSLRPGEDRLAFSVIMDLDSLGIVRKYRITESVIRSKHRYTYEEVEKVLNGGKDKRAKILHSMMMLSTILRRRREEDGSIDFDISEPVISLDQHGIPFEVRPKERLNAHRLIEEFMLTANVTVARHILEKKGNYPFIYRVHKQPEKEDMQSFLELLERLGIAYRITGQLEPEDYRKLLDIIENLEFRDFVEKVALRSMTKAVYSTENKGHFGLAFDGYTHFTSPIRRYADLAVHRLLKKYAAHGNPGKPEKIKQNLQDICASCNEAELRSVEAEREFTRLKSLEFLTGKTGEEFDGIISGVTEFGLFVELTHFLIEGLIHVSELGDDFYEYDRENYQLLGKETGKTYRLGDRVRVRIKTINLKERKADFDLI
ncbi:MAG: ribonuclease R [Spirochaetia bacterium]